MWVPWRPGNPGQQGRTRGIVSGGQAAAKARQRHRQAAFKRFKAGKLTPRQYAKALEKIERRHG